MPAPLTLTRDQILAFRRRVNALDQRLPCRDESLRVAARAGLQDSMPRAAVLSIHARVAGTAPNAWEHPAFIQVWGPRFSAFVVAAEDRAVFTLGRMPDDPAGIRRAEETATMLDRVLAGRRIPYGDAGRELGVSPNSLRYGTTTGRILIRWDGARQSEVWTVPPPTMAVGDARAELARRHLQIFGPATADTLAAWAGIRPRRAAQILADLQPELTAVRTPIGDRWILTSEVAGFHATAEPAAIRLLPSGDAYTLLWGVDRQLLVPDGRQQHELWTPRVWPGALLVMGEVAGVWWRTHRKVTVVPWRRLSAGDRTAVETEAESLPIPGDHERVEVTWEE